MTYQTDEPVHELRMSVSGRSWGELVHWIQDGDATYELPYQRGAVWTYEQRIMLIFSMLSGTPIPALIVNVRPDDMWFDQDGTQLPIYAVIDGQQRMTTVQMFMEDALPVPAPRGVRRGHRGHRGRAVRAVQRPDPSRPAALRVHRGARRGGPAGLGRRGGGGVSARQRFGHTTVV